MTENEFRENLEALCRRPSLYTPTGSFFEIASFIEGLAFGSNLGNHTSHSKMTPFLQWLAIKLGTNEPIIGWDDFRERFPSDADAFIELPSLYDEYCNSTHR